MGKKSSSYQEVDPNVGKAMLKQADLAQQYQDWYASEMAPMLMNQTERQIERSEKLSQLAYDQAYWLRDRTQAVTTKANARADAQSAQEKKTWPSAAAMADTARTFNEQAAYQRALEEAIADRTMGYGLQRQQLKRQLTSQGIDPTSGQYQSQFRAVGDAEANDKANADIIALRAARELGWTKKMQAIGVGQGYLNASINQANQATQTMGVGAGNSLSAIGQAQGYNTLGFSNIANLYNSYSSNTNSLLSQNQNVFNLGMGASNINLSSSIAANQNAATMAQGYGSAFGSLAGMATNLATTKMNTGSWTGK